MAVLHLDRDNFEQTISSAETALVDFWAPWCGPCKMLGPVFEEAEKEIGTKAVVAKVNVDEQQDLAAQFGITSIPTIVVFKNGKETSRSLGFIDKAKIVSLI
ncbi:MAG: thioredoxin [Treponema sp.]